MRGVSAGSTRRLPDIPRWSSSVPDSRRNRMYLARRPVSRTTCPLTATETESGTRQRRRGSWTARATILRPTTWGWTPRRVVSTSGSSGIGEGYIINEPSPGCAPRKIDLLDLRLFVRDVLALDRVVLLHFHLVRMEALV